jgi:mRNA interferase RelE/StbE
MYQVAITALAARVFEKADAPLQRKLDRCFEQLRLDPRRHNNIKALRGEFAGYLRFRIGDYRVVYRIDEAHRQVVVMDIAHRRDVYE